MYVEVNVGLKVGDVSPTFEEINARAFVAHHALKSFIAHNGATQVNIEIEDSDTEPTLTFGAYLSRMDIDDFKMDLYALAVALSQDCVALAVSDGNGGPITKGWLIGPQNDKWGEFNADYFKRAKGF